MEPISIYTTSKERYNYDPTRTTVLRNTFARDMKRRFTELIIVTKKSVEVNDCFGLKEEVHTLQMSPLGKKAFRFLRDSEKIEAFMIWLRKQVDAGIIKVGDFQQIGLAVEAAWSNKYILDSYKRGLLRARSEMKQIGMDVPTVEESGGINIAMMNPFHMDRVGVLFTRTFTDLKGITEAMDAQISRILAQGMIDGDGPALLAKKLIATIDGTGMGTLGITDTLGRFIPAKTRAITLARTEIIRAHHLATIQEYRNFGLMDIVIKGEWSTTNDDRVCPKCAAMDGKVFTLDEIEPMIPAHPNCRCIALPYIEELQQYRN